MLTISPIILALNIPSSGTNLSLFPNYNASGYNISVGTEDIGCFPIESRSQPVLRRDCNSALDKIFQSPDVMWDKKWEVAEAGSHILDTWVSGQCMIKLVAETLEAEDVFSEYTVAQQANKVIEQCVERGTRLGGIGIVGPKREFTVLLWNKIYKAPKPIESS